MHDENVTQEHKKHGNIRICFAEILVQLLGAGLDQGGFDGSRRQSCKCNYVDFYKEARPPC